MKRKTRKVILITLLSILCAAMVTGIAVVTAVLVGDGCDMPTKGNSTSSSSSSGSVGGGDDNGGGGDGWTDFH